MYKAGQQFIEKLRGIYYTARDWIDNHEALVGVIFGLLCIARIFRLDYIFFPPSWWDGGKLDFSDSMVQYELMIGYFIPDIPALLLAGLAIFFGWRAQVGGLFSKGKGGIIIGVLSILSILFINADDFMPLLTLTMTEAVHASAVERTPREDEYDLDVFVNVRPFGEWDDGRTVWMVTVDGTLTNNTANHWFSARISYALIKPDGSYVTTDGKKRIFISTKYQVSSGETINVTCDWYNPISDDQPSYEYEIVSIEIRAPRYNANSILSEEEMRAKAEMYAAIAEEKAAQNAAAAEEKAAIAAERAAREEYEWLHCPICGFEMPGLEVEELGYCVECGAPFPA